MPFVYVFTNGSNPTVTFAGQPTVFANNGNILALGTSSPSASGGNPEAASALTIGGSVVGGFLNAGPVSPEDDTAAVAIDLLG